MRHFSYSILLKRLFYILPLIAGNSKSNQSKNFNKNGRSASRNDSQEHWLKGRYQSPNQRGSQQNQGSHHQRPNQRGGGQKHQEQPNIG